MSGAGSADHYDYIVAGGGTAGCVLANRLSADPRHKVLLVEAGPRDRNPLYAIPIMGMHLWRWKYNNWSFQTEPEPGLEGRRIGWPRGRVLGGSSSMNGMIYTRGAAEDYDRWAQAGMPSWSYDKVLPYFKKLESYEGEPSEYRGTEGPIRVSRLDQPHPLFDAFVQAGQQAGLPYNPDFNGKALEGVGRYDTNIAGGQRQSTARTYLQAASGRANLDVLTGASIERIVLDGTRATGVVVRTKGGRRTVRAAREIVLAAGAIGSPMALLHSGIGDSEELAQAGIQTRHALKGVGRNLQDHLNITHFYSSAIPDMFYEDARFDRALGMLAQAFLTRSGKGAMVPHNAGAFLKSDPRLASPDLQIHFLPAGVNSRQVRLPFQRVLGDSPYGIAAHICHLHPESRGTVSLRSSDPADRPRIQANYLTAAADKIAMRAGFRFLEKLFAQPAFQEVTGQRLAPPDRPFTDDEVDSWLRENASTVYHPVGTCKMGTDAMAVVDERLRVHGLTGLRVADAAIMPTLVSANTHAPTVMIAEKAADMMIEDRADQA
ncbi:FAD-binding protein [Aurantiacibacter xanthus]|uniref:FAD-binding protein n=1 Tax=Aurantiacibacter xanthus TaxID=1784712 RepID=A0A3A1P7V1_9SPHN|nr:GMC family oxidoreductase N-terminal domain-containing protein [Aurantiacibacter xanthus]RIV86333.1 FAD-binding protein [Aurantiacibacter xanthus]